MPESLKQPVRQQPNRESLARDQSALLDALLGDGPVPPGFDAARVNIAADALASKRARSIAKAWPALAIALGDDFQRQMHLYTAAAPSPPPGGPATDGYDFAAFLLASNRLNEPARLEFAALRLRMRRTAAGLATTSRPRAACVRLISPCRLAIGVRLGSGRAWWVRVPIWPSVSRRSAPTNIGALAPTGKES